MDGFDVGIGPMALVVAALCVLLVAALAVVRFFRSVWDRKQKPLMEDRPWL